MVPYKVTRTDNNALKVNFFNIKAGWDAWVLARADAHHDHEDCDRAMEKRDLDEARKRNALIMDFGDMFCGMQGRNDRRSSKSALRMEYKTSSYLNSLVDEFEEFYGPYHKNWLLFGKGNHETGMIRALEFDPVAALSQKIYDKTKTRIPVLGYTGWIWFNFQHDSKTSYRQIAWYTHGYGGGGPVSHDIIQAHRQKVYVENADIMFSAHVHRSWLQEDIKQRLNKHGVIENRRVWYCKVPTYKDEYKKGEDGWAVVKGHGPRPKGAYWLHFFFRNKQIHTEILKAI